MNIRFEEIIQGLSEKISQVSMDEEKINKLVSDAGKKLQDSPVFANILEDIRTAMEMLVDWKTGRYTSLSQKTVILLLAGLLYLVNPLNILPKFLKKTLIDDIVIIAYMLKRIKDELEEYKLWKAEQGLKGPSEDEDRIYIEIN